MDNKGSTRSMTISRATWLVRLALEEGAITGLTANRMIVAIQMPEKPPKETRKAAFP